METRSIRPLKSPPLEANGGQIVLHSLHSEPQRAGKVTAETKRDNGGATELRKHGGGLLLWGSMDVI